MHPEKTPRFRINPVEVTIFSVVTLICINSVYNLFYDRQSYQTSDLAPMASGSVSEGRTIAASPSTSAILDIGCSNQEYRETTAEKIRLNGILCNSTTKSEAIPFRNPATSSARLIRTFVVNQANNFNATIFPEINSGKYSTDYIPLEPGRNALRVEFMYSSGRIVSQDLEILRSE